MPRTEAPPFFAIPSLSVLCYIASAACLLLGVGLTLAPMVGGTDFRNEAFLVTGVLHLYECALLGLAIFLARRRAPEWDLRSVMVFLALFMVATTMSIDVLAAAHPTIAIAIGAVTAAFGIIKVWVLQRCVARGHRLPGAPLFVGLLIINALMPGTLGWATATHGVISGLPQSIWWGTGVVIMLLIAFMLIKIINTRQGAWQLLIRKPQAAVGPILLRVSAAVFLFATLIHHSVLGYTMDLGVEVGHLLPGLLVLALLTYAGLRALRLLWTPIIWSIAISCLAASLGVLYTGTYAISDTIASQLIHPAALLCWAGLIGLVVSWRWHDQRLIDVSLLALGVGLPLLASTPDLMRVNTDIALTIACCVLVLGWWSKKDHVWLYSLGGVVGAWCLFSSIFGLMDSLDQRERIALAMLSACSGPWLHAWLLPPAARGRDLLVSGLVCSLGSAAWSLHTNLSLSAWFIMAVIVTIIASSTCWRIRRWEPSILALGPAGYALIHLQHVAIGWLLMAGSFLLLGLGALASWWRSTHNDLPAPPLSDPDQHEPTLHLSD